MPSALGTPWRHSYQSCCLLQAACSVIPWIITGFSWRPHFSFYNTRVPLTKSQIVFPPNNPLTGSPGASRSLCHTPIHLTRILFSIMKNLIYTCPLKRQHKVCDQEQYIKWNRAEEDRTCISQGERDSSVLGVKQPNISKAYLTQSSPHHHFDLPIAQKTMETSCIIPKQWKLSTAPLHTERLQPICHNSSTPFLPCFTTSTTPTSRGSSIYMTMTATLHKLGVSSTFPYSLDFKLRRINIKHKSLTRSCREYIKASFYFKRRLKRPSTQCKIQQ